MGILGMVGSESFAANRFKSVRRSVFYDYPNGAAPLTGLTSLLKEEACSDYEYKWHEKRLSLPKTITAGDATNGPFYGAAATTETWGSTVRTGGNGVETGNATTAGAMISLRVADDTIFRAGHVIEIRRAALHTGVYKRLVFRVAKAGAADAVRQASGTPASAGGAGYLDCYWVQGPSVNGAGVENQTNTVNVGLDVIIVGSAHSQGAVGSSMGVWNLPALLYNYTQIFRQSFSISGTAAKIPATFDRGGVYEDRAKEASINHMIEMERAFMFGARSVDGSTDPVTSTTGGILWFLEQYELTSGNPYGVAGATLDTDEGKRIIENTTGIMTEKLYDSLLERIFRTVKNRANEKLVLCGNGFLNVMNQLYRSKSVLQDGLPMGDTYGMDVIKHRCPFGTVYYKTHPLFNQNPVLWSCALYLDTGCLIYRYLTGRDTELLENRQQPDADHRKDEWLTECGLEVRYPEAFMFMKNVLDYGP